MTKLGAAMKQVKVGKSAVGKEFWQPSSFDGLQRRRQGGCIGGRINEENARFALLACCLLLYMIFGAIVYHFLESGNEAKEKEIYRKILIKFKQNYCSNHYVNCTALDELLDRRGNFSAAGFMTGTSKWDFPGAFHFVGTIVSTIGFGTTTPRTKSGRLFTIFYGFFGCAAGILFFNLFLERIITGIAYIIRFLHDKNPFGAFWRRRSTVRTGTVHASRRPEVRVRVQSQDSDDLQSEVSVPPWKPPVHKVFCVLLMLAMLLVLIAASVYHAVEHWSYLESVYFCFSSFATIGFGDFVPGQQPIDTPNILWYQMLSACFMIFGCCFVYSLFNVTSILIRQFLNIVIRSLNCQCQKFPRFCRKKRHRYLGLGLRPPDPDDVSDTERDPQDGIISLKEFLEQNKMNIFLMQKHLVESTQHEKEAAVAANSISAASVGPLAILTRQFGED